MCSAGIGSKYETSYNAKRNRYRGKETKETYKLEDGNELPLPKYYHDKLYTEEERENLWIIKQERGYRYIAGEKVSTDNLEEWDNLTRYYQRRAELLYGDNPEDWKREKVKARLEKMEMNYHCQSITMTNYTPKKNGYRDWETDRKSTRLNSSHITRSRMPSSA